MDSHQNAAHILPFVIIMLFLMTLRAVSDEGVFNVKTHGAKGNGKDNDSKAFLSAWSALCSYSNGESSTMLIPKGSYLIGPLLFEGKCARKVNIQLNGNLLGSTNIDDYSMKDEKKTLKNWIKFKGIENLNIYGGGILDGQGGSSWHLNNCSQNRCRKLPNTLVLSYLTNGSVSNIASINSKFFHMTMYGCKGMTIDSVTITAPDDSPNTDGIHIGASTDVKVLNSVIGTGDDCISIGPSVTGVTIHNVTCGPGHGISVGSLGSNLKDMPVEHLTVTNCTFIKSDNGVRIKTWQSSPSKSHAAHFLFDHITMMNARNPIIIDQKYCPYNNCNTTEPSKVQIKDVQFINFRGTSSTEVAIKLVCSESYPCEDIKLSNINLEYNGPKGKKTTSICVNARGTSSGTMNPESCLSPPKSFRHLPYSHGKYLTNLSDHTIKSSSVSPMKSEIYSLFGFFCYVLINLLVL